MMWPHLACSFPIASRWSWRLGFCSGTMQHMSTKISPSHAKSCSPEKLCNWSVGNCLCHCNDLCCCSNQQCIHMKRCHRWYTALMAVQHHHCHHILLLHLIISLHQPLTMISHHHTVNCFLLQKIPIIKHIDPLVCNLMTRNCIVQ